MKTSTDQEREQQVEKSSSVGRWIGLLLFLGGGVLAYFSTIMPLIDASRQEADVSISLKAVMLTPALLVIGSILFVMGNERAGKLFGSREKKSPVGIAICIVTAGIGILLYEWLKSRLRAYGYGI